MIINFGNIGGGGGGGSYTLPTATANRLGGVKVGSGLTVENDGTLNVSGGTSYELPVATDQVLGGIKVGSGLAIDSGGTLSVSGGTGGGGGDYKVVSGLPQSAEKEGQLYFVPRHAETVSFNGIYLTTEEEENYVGRLYKGNDEQVTEVYISGGEFHWGWENDGEIHQMGDFYYKTDGENKTFTFYVPDGWYVDPQNNTTTGETTGIDVQKYLPDTTYRANSALTFDFDEGQNVTYLHFDWSRKDDGEYSADFVGKVFTYNTDHFSNVKLVLDNYTDVNSNSFSVELSVRTVNGSNAVFAGMVPIYNGGAKYECPIGVIFTCDKNSGGIGYEECKVQPVLRAYIDSDTHAISANNAMFFNRSLGFEASYVFEFMGRYFNASEHSANHIAFDGVLSGIRYHGEWSTNDDGAELLKWTEEPEALYVIHSGVTGVGLDNANWNRAAGTYKISAEAFATITAETDLLEVGLYGDKMKVTTDGTDLNMYVWDGGQETYVLQGTEGWDDETDIDPGDMPYGMYISDIATGATEYTFKTNSHDYGPENTYNLLYIDGFSMPFAGLQVFDTSDNHLKVFNGTQWVQIA